MGQQETFNDMKAQISSQGKEIHRLEHRVAELLQANNRELEKRRSLEGQVEQLKLQDTLELAGARQYLRRFVALVSEAAPLAWANNTHLELARQWELEATALLKELAG